MTVAILGIVDTNVNVDHQIMKILIAAASVMYRNKHGTGETIFDEPIKFTSSSNCNADQLLIKNLHTEEHKPTSVSVSKDADGNSICRTQEGDL